MDQSPYHVDPVRRDAVSVAAASGLSRGTVMRGIAELRTAPRPERSQPIRRKGAGRKRTVDQDATLKRDLEALVEPAMEARPLPFRPLNRRSGRIPADPYPPFKCLHCRTAILARRR
jgi:GTP1/Obg family GTP-binding protein